MNLTYNFLQDNEPTDEQLEALMQEVGEEVRKKRKIADANFNEVIQKEIKLAAERVKSLKKNQK